MVKHIRIISLGEILAPSIPRAMNAFISLVANKQGDEADIPLITKQMTSVLHNKYALIEKFRLGMDENDFNNEMIQAIAQATGVKLSVKEFDDAWNAMNSPYKNFSEVLNQAILYNNQDDHEVIFVSATNPKDIRHLIAELDENRQEYTKVNDELNAIGQIKLYTTYTTHLPKDELILSIIKNLKNSNKTTLANSMQEVLGGKQNQEHLDIKYVRGVNNIEDPLLQKELDRAIVAIAEKANSHLVDTIIWVKSQPLLAFLTEQETLIPPVKLAMA